MARRCDRPDCHGPATTTLTYDYASATVWLDGLEGEPHPMRHELCARHADGLSLPRGWTLQDHRSIRQLPLGGVGAALAS
ncbi:MAG: DUF3499 family protein [Actinobacteria bacterium]|nr:DUF3499 family protein [Actinomycetota bacterium]